MMTTQQYYSMNDNNGTNSNNDSNYNNNPEQFITF